MQERTPWGTKCTRFSRRFITTSRRGERIFETSTEGTQSEWANKQKANPGERVLVCSSILGYVDGVNKGVVSPTFENHPSFSTSFPQHPKRLPETKPNGEGQHCWNWGVGEMVDRLVQGQLRLSPIMLDGILAGLSSLSQQSCAEKW